MFFYARPAKRHADLRPFGRRSTGQAPASQPASQTIRRSTGRRIPATAAAAKAPPLHSEKISRFAVYCYICGRIFISDTMTQHISYPTVGTCSRQIDIELEEGVIRSVTFTGGCSGNTQGIAALVRGMKAADAVARLEGIDCRGKGTSCPDQLAKALKQAL
jgi:uncharacterized protein TIGR03905